MHRKRLTVVLPTYCRPGALVWSIVSILRQRLPDAAALSPRIVVVNNNGPRHDVETAVQHALGVCPDAEWDVQVVHRDAPLFPVRNWYESIREFSGSGDVVFLHGDDDLMIPDTLEQRYLAIADTDAVMQVCGAAGTATFRQSGYGVEAILHPPLTSRPTRSQSLSCDFPSFGDLARHAPLISCHAYQNSPRLWGAYDDAIAAFQTWVGRRDQHIGLLPYALPLFLTDKKDVQRIRVEAVYRGMELDSLYVQGRGAGGWDVIELTVAFLMLLESPSFSKRRELDDIRLINARFALTWFPRGMSAGAREIVGRYGYGHLLSYKGAVRSLVMGCTQVFREKLGINFLSVRRDVRKGHFTSLADFIALFHNSRLGRQ